MPSRSPTSGRAHFSTFSAYFLKGKEGQLLTMLTIAAILCSFFFVASWIGEENSNPAQKTASEEIDLKDLQLEQSYGELRLPLPRGTKWRLSYCVLWSFLFVFFGLPTYRSDEKRFFLFSCFFAQGYLSCLCPDGNYVTAQCGIFHFSRCFRLRETCVLVFC